MPKKILTKKGILFFKWLGKRIFNHTIGYILLILVLIIGYKYLENRALKGLFGQQTDQLLKLQKGQKRGVEIDFRRKTMRTVERRKDGSEEEIVHSFSGLRRATIIEMDDGSVKINAPTIGFTFEPGYSGFISRGRPHLGLDLEWFYWRRLGLSSGVGISNKIEAARDKTLSFAAYPLALNYNLPFKLTPNTNVFLGTDDQLKPIGGVNVKW